MATKPTSSSSTTTTTTTLHHKKPTLIISNPDSPESSKHISELLSLPILLSEQITQTTKQSKFFKSETSEISKQVTQISHLLRTSIRLSTSTPNFYDRPFRRISTELLKTLHKTLTLVQKTRRRNFLRRVVSIITSTDFRKLTTLLESSTADLKWALSISESSSTINLSLPPIASNDPIISWVWSFISSLHLLSDDDFNKIEAANELASLARDNDRNKQIIVNEGGVLPLLKLLKDGSRVDGQVAAATALFNLANDDERVRVIIRESGVPVIVHVLSGSVVVRVQVKVADLVAQMARHCGLAQEDFAREHVIRPLVTLLSFDLFVDEMKWGGSKTSGLCSSIHSVVQINKEMERGSLYGGKGGFGSSLSMSYGTEGSGGKGGGVSGGYKKERENEKPEVKLSLKISCGKALWMLARGSVANSRRITETKGLLCLAKVVETGEEDELQYNCLMTIMEITAAAESNADLRRAAFKTNSPAAKAVVDQLLRVIKESDNPDFQVAAVRAIGSLARTFPARESRVVGPLVEQLGHRNIDVAIEASISLGKFACPDNFLCVEHSKSIIEFKGVPPLMRLLRSGNERAQLHGLILVCYLAINAGKSNDLERAGVLNTFEGVDRGFVAQHPVLRELIPQAVYHLSVFHQSHSGMLVQRQFFA